jgi:hypothetical protein
MSVARSVIQSSVSLDFKILAIVSTLKDYRLCWFLNQTMQWNLTRVEDLELRDGTGGGFSHFLYADESEKSLYHLVSNKNGTDFLVPELKTNDFFLLVKGHCPPATFDHFQETLRTISQVQAVFSIEPKSLSSVNNLIIDDQEF